MVEIEVMNGTIKIGDLILSMPGNDYGGLVGTVTDIKLLGSIDRETDNETDDIYVNFGNSDYSEKRQNEIEKEFADMYDEHRPFDELPLDMVIMPPDALINITNITEDELCGLLNSEEIAIFYWNNILFVNQPKWTVCWKSGDKGDGWNQFPNRDDVVNLINTLVREGNVNESDILIFPPDARKIAYDNLEDGVSLNNFKAEPDINKKRCKCSHDRFTAQQRCYG